jgi:hypothetical protein
MPQPARRLWGSFRSWTAGDRRRHCLPPEHDWAKVYERHLREGDDERAAAWYADKADQKGRCCRCKALSVRILARAKMRLAIAREPASAAFIVVARSYYLGLASEELEHCGHVRIYPTGIVQKKNLGY